MIRILLLILFSGINYTTYSQTTEAEKVLHTASGDLCGRLIVPAGKRKFDVIILQPGSGPTDRNGNNPLGVKANSYRMLADSLVQYGIATLLIDKRGIGASKAAGADESKLVFDDYIKDIELWFRFLKKDPRADRLILAGHSEGSLIAMVAAQKVPADKYISISGPAEPIDDIIFWQLKQQVPLLAPAARDLFDKMKRGETIDSVPPMLYTLFRPSIQPYMRSWMSYNPCQEIKKLRMPVLILQGTTDVQVQKEEAAALHQCNTAAKLEMITGMNHVLKEAPLDPAANKATYMDPSLPLLHDFVTSIVSFIKSPK
ncbi:MAG: alpha/beta fold hydrolase [Niabella sp.]